MPTPVNKEILELKAWLGKPPRSPDQVNGLNTADAEILRLKKPFKNLALTTDTICDEIHWGLYKEPFTIGYMSVMASLSDLAAVGAEPLGVLLATQWPRSTPLSWKKDFARGASQALKRCRAPLLGGDSGESPLISVTSTALGACKDRPLERKPVAPGDLLYSLGPLGRGPALGLKTLMKLPDASFEESMFRPRVSFLEPQAIPLIKACMDNSDGVASSLCVLADLNGISWHLDIKPSLFDPQSRGFVKRNGLPLLSLLFAEHGDYNLLVAVDPRRQKDFEGKVRSARRLGSARKASRGHSITMGGRTVENFPLDFVFAASRHSLKELQGLFLKWFELIKALNLNF